MTKSVEVVLMDNGAPVKISTGDYLFGVVVRNSNSIADAIFIEFGEVSHLSRAKAQSIVQEHLDTELITETMSCEKAMEELSKQLLKSLKEVLKNDQEKSSTNPFSEN